MTSNVAMQWFQNLWMKLWYTWYKYIWFYCALSLLVLKHLRLPYPCSFIWQEKSWRHLLPYTETNQVSVFCLGFLVTKFCSNSMRLGKQRKMEKEKQKRICDAIVVIFCFVSTEVSWSPGVNKIWIHSTQIRRLLGFFLWQEIFHKRL